MAILLREEGLLDRTMIYATDINPASLEKARQGIFPLAHLRSFTDNYQAAGGKTAFSDYTRIGNPNSRPIAPNTVQASVISA